MLTFTNAFNPIFDHVLFDPITFNMSCKFLYKLKLKHFAHKFSLNVLLRRS